MKTVPYSRPVILCIDDANAALELNIRKQVLEKAGYSVLSTTSTHKALEIFRENHVDLVLTEQGLPTLSDDFTLASMKMQKPHVPIAIYSADLAESPKEMRFADAFVSKLVTVNELLRTIKKLLAKGPTGPILAKRAA